MGLNSIMMMLLRPLPPGMSDFVDGIVKEQQQKHKDSGGGGGADGKIEMDEDEMEMMKKFGISDLDFASTSGSSEEFVESNCSGCDL